MARGAMGRRMVEFTPAAIGPRLHLPQDTPPILLVIVDTEEEFDWSAEFDRNATGVSHMREIGRFQEICDRCGVRPTYALDYPVATQEDGIRALRPFLAEGRAEIAAQLHPWVNPPHEEVVNRRNSYPGNLPPALEHRKIAALTDAITDAFGVHPLSYKAGRYGLGPGTVESLAALGYRSDLSFAPGFDLSEDGGPDYSRVSSDIAWLDREGGLLELPATGGFVGALRAAGPTLQRLAGRTPGRQLRLGGILGRGGLMTRIRLSPEGYSLADTRRLTRVLHGDGLRVFSFTLHSPSVQPGCTSYVRDADDLRAFLAHIRDYFRYFLEELGGVAMTPEQFRQSVANRAPGRTV